MKIISKEFKTSFIYKIRDIGQEIHQNAIDKGFWPPEGRNKGEMMMLEVSEIAERLEAIRNLGITDHDFIYSAPDTCKCGSRVNEHGPLMDEHCPEFTSEEIEAADLFIRLMDYATAFKLRLAEAILAKHEYNKTRPHKHGKAF